MTEEGTKASDTFSTIVQTAKKLKVSVFDYIGDRVSKSFKMPSLAKLIETKKSSGFGCQDNGQEIDMLQFPELKECCNILADQWKCIC